MSLSAIQLDAFHAVARCLHFSRAAKELHVTQSALSQRIKKLEEEIGQLLFVRGTGGVSLTDAGTRLLRYCQVRGALEAELLADLSPEASSGLGGAVRVAGYSSVTRSVLLPALAPLLREHAALQAVVFVRELGELVSLLHRAAADVVVLDRAHEREGIEHVILGEEQLVLIESAAHATRADVYLDHDPDDETTLRFLRRNGVRTTRLQRSFLDDIYGLLDGVEHGLGRAVVPKHLLAGRSGVRVVKGLRAARTPVVLHRLKQPSYSRAQEAVLDALVSRAPRLLAAKVR